MRYTCLYLYFIRRRSRDGFSSLAAPKKTLFGSWFRHDTPEAPVSRSAYESRNNVCVLNSDGGFLLIEWGVRLRKIPKGQFFIVQLGKYWGFFFNWMRYEIETEKKNLPKPDFLYFSLGFIIINGNLSLKEQAQESPGASKGRGIQVRGGGLWHAAALVMSWGTHRDHRHDCDNAASSTVSHIRSATSLRDISIACCMAFVISIAWLMPCNQVGCMIRTHVESAPARPNKAENRTHG